MKDEIKEILDNLKYTAKKHTIQVLENGGKIEHCPQEIETELRLNTYSANILLDYITNLQYQLSATETNEETFRLEMLDITKCLGLDEDTIFDDVKEKATNLQEENERLNNIINELEKWLIDEYSKYNGAIRIANVLDKLKELKEGK